jgi:serine/threonine-protein kinase
MICNQCNTPVPDHSKFCLSCGSQVSNPDLQAAATAAMDEAGTLQMENLLKADTKGDFEIGDMLGRGGMAVVYYATDVHLSRPVAIKVLPPELTFGHGIERFKREAKIAAKLDHPNIIPIYRIASGGKVFWYAMKYLEGESLDQKLRNTGRFSLEETIDVLGQIADALDYAHEHEVIHRDVKPANVLLDSRGRVVVTDFGIAKPLTESSLTASGSVIGTPHYMSPEQGSGRPVHGPSDQYSLAVMAYEMLGGKRPFEGDSAIDVVHKHVMVQPEPLERHRPGLPKHVYQAIHKGLAKKPDQRFSSVSAMVEALKAPWAGADAAETLADDLAAAATVASPSMQSAEAATTPFPSEPPAPPTTPTTPLPHSTAAQSQAAATGDKKRSRMPALIAAGLVVAIGGTWVVMQDGTPAEPPAVQTAVTTPSTTGSQAEQPAGGTVDPPDPGNDRQGQSTPVTTEDSTPSRPRAVEPPPVTPPGREARATTGRVRIAGLPVVGTVAIDDADASRRRDFELEPGQHVVVMRAAGYETITDTVNVVAGESTRIRFSGRQIFTRPSARDTTVPPAAEERPARERLGVLVVRLRGGWANIYVDGEHMVRGQLTQPDTVAAGEHLIHVEGNNFLPVDTTIVVQAGQRTIVTIPMRRNDR